MLKLRELGVALITASAFASATAAPLPDAVKGKASGGLIQIATTGNPAGLHQQLGGNIMDSRIVVETIGQNILNGLLDVNQGEHLAPQALVSPSGDIYAMVAPTITKDNFVLITADTVARRMDVGSTEGDNAPYVVSEIDPRVLPQTVKGAASAGLLQLATTGNPEGLNSELRGSRVDDSIVVAQRVGQAALDAILKLDAGESLAPKALITQTGEIYAMVAPKLTKDNFVLVTQDGQIYRMDVGSTEGTNLPYRVTKVVPDGGTPWYTEFWYWLTGA